jgi:hypothetical protein
MPAFAQSDEPSLAYRVVAERVIDSGGLGALAVDPNARALYGVGSKVIRLADDSIVGALSPALGHGYAFADELGRGITRRGAIFDLRTFALIRSGGQFSPSAVAYDHLTQRAAMNFDTLKIIDVATTGVVGGVYRGVSESLVADGRGHFFADLDSDSIAVVDARTAKVTARWTTGSCLHPIGMTINAVRERLFISCANHELIVMDSKNGRIVSVVTTSWAADQLAYDEGSGLLFIPTEHDTLTVVQERGPDMYEVAANIAVNRIRSAVAVDTSTHNVYLVRFGLTDSDAQAITLITLAPLKGSAPRDQR